ncbi:hypothetical protein FS837_009341 [Tulasnella sp. UAMH 9824]|nr:hypothetical protein FS837_009341 [Tulasnella sp. UAMH 9824]
MSSNELVVAKKTIATFTAAKQVNQDAWMTMWCNTNWGDLLQPAPLSIALLGSILVIASSTDDFSLLTERNPNDTSPAVTWEFAKHPDSFKSCLQQMVADGSQAFESSHINMTRIRDASGQIPEAVSSAVMLTLQATPNEVEMILPHQIKNVLQLAWTCQDAAQACETTFGNISGLAQEMVLACTHKVGTDQEKIEANKIHLEVLRIQKEQEALAVQQAQENHEMMKKSFQQVETDFHDAVRDVPKGWDLVGMQAVESLTSLVVAAGNTAISASTLRSQALQAGLGAFKNSSIGGGKEGAGQVSVPPNPPSTAPNGVATQNNAAALSDPGLQQARRALDMANTINQLINGGPDGHPDWDKIRGEDGGTNGGEYVKASLEKMKSRLDPTKPISVNLDVYIGTAIEVISSIIDTAKSPGGSPTALDAQKPKVEKLISDLQQLVTSTNLLLQQTGAAPVGPATPPAPQGEMSSSTVKIAVENAKFAVDQTRENLKASRDAFDKVSTRLAEGQKSITKTIGEMTAISLSNASLEKILPVLRKAVGAFTTLRAQFSQLVQFFHSVASLLTDVMEPSVERWADTLESSMKLGGVSIGAFTRHLRQMIYTQLMVPMKVSMLSQKISNAYLNVSDQHILPAQRNIGQMLQFATDDTPARAAKLRKAHEVLQKSSTTASQEISALVKAEHEKFSETINQRLGVIEGNVKSIPAIAAPAPDHVKQITAAHVQDFDAGQTAHSKNNTMFDPEDVM